jgi:hypothetical protein
MSIFALQLWVILFYNKQWKMGWNMLIPSIVQCVFLIISIFPTEMALRKKFTDEGIRR